MFLFFDVEPLVFDSIFNENVIFLKNYVKANERLLPQHAKKLTSDIYNKLTKNETKRKYTRQSFPPLISHFPLYYCDNCFTRRQNVNNFFSVLCVYVYDTREKQGNTSMSCCLLYYLRTTS